MDVRQILMFPPSTSTLVLRIEVDDPGSRRPSSDSWEPITNFGGSGGGTSETDSSDGLSATLYNNPSEREISLATNTVCGSDTFAAACLLNCAVASG